MKTRKLIAVGALVAIAVVAAAVALGDRGSDPSGVAVPPQPPVASNEGAIDIDAVLSGREAAPPPAPERPNAAQGQPAKQIDRAASAPGAPAQPGGSPDALLQDDGRKVVQTASLRLQVEEVGGAFEEVGRIATAAGGFVASSSFSYQGDDQIAAVTVRVPATAYQNVLSDLRRLAKKVDSEDSKANDVTEQYTDLQSRLRNLEATEAQLLQLLARAQTVTDIITVQDRLSAVRGEIEQVKGRIQLIDRLSEMATITVHLRPVVAGAGGGGATGLGAEISEAWKDSLEFLEGVAAAVVSVVVFLWWLPILALPAALVAARLSRGSGRPARAAD
ncbi:MAG TPA: DUF4349 domain-containing protein [Dehalococcoidia bacterium]|nr:DUF4349 domain-containing protein [Dehalococcoidia bacterium]